MSDEVEADAGARNAPGVSDEVRGLIEAGKPREALRRHQELTGAAMAEAMAALSQAARELRGD